MKAPAWKQQVVRLLAMLGAGALLFGTAAEFYGIASGTGTWVGGFSLKWAAAFVLAALTLLAAWVIFGSALWHPARFSHVQARLLAWRARLGPARWLLLAAFLLGPVWFLQFSAWGVVFAQPYVRVLIWVLAAAGVAWLVGRGERLWSHASVLAGIVLTGAAFIAAVPLGQVTSYPFALGWSEGNRLWDYSLAFASTLYKYPASDPPAAYLEPGRQLVGALPFLLPHVTIAGERLWLALLDILPYLALGLLAFRPAGSRKAAGWVLAGIWGFTFLSQGPIHPPLLVCAILVAAAWGAPLWLAAILLAASGYFAAISRFTWIFAPAIWIVMLEFASARPAGARVPGAAWLRSAVLGAAGLLGSMGIPRVLALLGWQLGIRSSASGAGAAGLSVSTQQALLWYRLFPNATYGSGILLGLLEAAGPLALILLFLVIRRWRPATLQGLALLLPLLVFLAVGLVISTKIGGGGDLHNLDMFLIALLFTAALVWRELAPASGGFASAWPLWLRGVALIAVVLPAYHPLISLRPISFAGDESWLLTLTGATRPKDLGSLPSDEVTAAELGKLRVAVQAAAPTGEVLFIDQRQLLTFGSVTGIPLVPEYEKKQMMDEALSGNRAYFDPFYHDLASRRFSLIISDPLRTPIKDSDYGFGEENNAWVTWVTKPVLCYYEEKDTLTNVRVELLTPRAEPVDCSGVLP